MSVDQVHVRVWDWTVRTFHWSLVVLVAAMWWTADQGHMVWHKWLGLLLLALLVYRLIWGFIGPASARLLPLLPKPRALLRYAGSLKKRPYTRWPGHNPLGGLSVLALLGLLILQVGSGLFAIDVDGLASGWFGHVVSFETGRNISGLHEACFNLLVALIALHLIAIAAYYLLLRVNLVGPMVTGRQSRPSFPKGYIPAKVSVIRFGVAVSSAALSAWLVVWFGR